MPTISPHVVEKRTGSYLEISVRAQVNKHEPEIVLFIIDTGKFYRVSTTRTGLGDGLVYKHQRLEVAKTWALKQVWKQFHEGCRVFKNRVTLYG